MDLTKANENSFQKNGSMSRQAGAAGSREGVPGWVNGLVTGKRILKINSGEKMKFRTEVYSTWFETDTGRVIFHFHFSPPVNGICSKCWENEVVEYKSKKIRIRLMSRSCKGNRTRLFYRIFRSHRKWWKARVKCSQSDDDKHANRDSVTRRVKGERAGRKW